MVVSVVVVLGTIDTILLSFNQGDAQKIRFWITFLRKHIWVKEGREG